MRLSIEPIDVATATRLINFGVRKSVPDDLAQDQLRGTVALYNMLAKQGFAYLADEVGMGKTYVALGVAALMRHFHQKMRVLYIAPRENIQKKWHKEIRNFTTNNWLMVDQRVKTFQQTPAVEPVVCNSLADFVKSVYTNDQRDFILRLTSMSLALPKDRDRWTRKRREIFRYIPWLPRENFSLHSKDEFKEAYARAVNVAMPHFDLLILDEGHNLKHGFGRTVAARNRALGIMLGHPDDENNWPKFRGCDRKVDRVLVLSATPLEEDFEEMWHQMNVLGFGKEAQELKNRDLDPAIRKQLARKYLIRRLTGISIEGKRHTKNMYRREWRSGGVSVHDEPLQLAGDKQRLVVALVQKKVADVLAKMGRSKGKKFCRSFQIGMLSSFESFMETAKVKMREDESCFDQSDQTDSNFEKDGVDTNSINSISRSYKLRFKKSLPHPKMDTVSRDVAAAMLEGRKTLVFVRRVATVAEFVEKVSRTYDQWIQQYLLSKSEGGVKRNLEKQIEDYENSRSDRSRAIESQENEQVDRDEEGDDPEQRAHQFPDDEDQGSSDNFFSWFFRGKRKLKVLSGAIFRKNRLDSEGSVFSTIFDNNYVSYLLNNADDPLGAIATRTGKDRDKVARELRELAHAVFKWRSTQKKFPRLRVFRAYQEAALRYLAKQNGSDLAGEIRVVIDEAFPGRGPRDLLPVDESFPQPDDHLKTSTFFCELRKRPGLYDALWPKPGYKDFRLRFRERERRRELLASAISLGHPYIDLWLLAVAPLKSLSISESRQETSDVISLINKYLDTLEAQRDQTGITSYSELRRIAKNFRLIADVNFPNLQDKSLAELRGYLGATLGSQTPVGGISGGVNARMVKQFRMPGYPFVLVSTNVLQEGEDLHTFANRVIHYGISWTPSSMEQRTGRIDRIGSLTHRQLKDSQHADPSRFLQVYYPHLKDTVELVQVREIYRRMNRFVRMLHETLSSKEKDESSVDLSNHLLKPEEDTAPIEGLLQSSFDIEPDILNGASLEPAVNPKEVDRHIEMFVQICQELEQKYELDWEPDSRKHAIIGTAFVRFNRLVSKGSSRGSGARHQPFTLFLRTASGGGKMLLRFSSPIGSIETNNKEKINQVLEIQQEMNTGKLCAVHDAKHKHYLLSAQKDILFSPETTQIQEVMAALSDTIVFADIVELKVLNEDKPLKDLWKELEGAEEDAGGEKSTDKA